MISKSALQADLAEVLKKHARDDEDLELSIRVHIRPNAKCEPYKKGEVIPNVDRFDITVDSLPETG